MSLVSKSKSTKEKKAVKEQKTPTMTSVTVNGGNGLSASAYNPILGTFHTLEASSISSNPFLHVNGRFCNIDDSDDNSGSTQGSGADYDSASNNDSHSVESEDHNKDKTTNAPSKQDVIPGADNDKREKIRQKNERKHQRQREKRAQELLERCSGYLMSRKLEALAQQLVAMGFSHERATMALILNEGKVEEAVAWLFEGGEDVGEDKNQNIETRSNLKVDISEQLARIAELEVKFKCSKPDVERVVVACEGDLDKAEETLRSQKQEPPPQPKPDEIVDPPAISNGKVTIAVNQSSARLPQKPNSVSSVPQRREERDFNYTKAAVTLDSATKPVPKVVQPVTRVQQKSEWTQPRQISSVAEKRWPAGGGSSPSVLSYSLASSVQVSSPSSKTESLFVPVGHEFKNIHPGEHVVMMQRPQSVNAKQSVATSVSSSSASGAASGWYPSNTEFLNTNGLLPTMPNPRSLSRNNPSLLTHHPMQYLQHHQPSMSGNSAVDNPITSWGNALWSGTNGSPTLAAASSLGLFSGLRSTCTSGSTSPVDWNTSESMPSCDYTSIDWSLDRSFLPSKPNGLCFVFGQYSRNYGHGHDLSTGVSLGTRPPSKGNGMSIFGLHDGAAASVGSSSAISREWTSAFEGKDLFSLPRQFVSSPSL